MHNLTTRTTKTPRKCPKNYLIFLQGDYLAVLRWKIIFWHHQSIFELKAKSILPALNLERIKSMKWNVRESWVPDSQELSSRRSGPAFLHWESEVEPCARMNLGSWSRQLISLSLAFPPFIPPVWARHRSHQQSPSSVSMPQITPAVSSGRNQSPPCLVFGMKEIKRHRFYLNPVTGLV